MLHSELGVRDLFFSTPSKANALERLPEFMRRIVPEDDPLLIELGLSPLTIPILHAQSSGSFEALDGLQGC